MKSFTQSLFLLANIPVFLLIFDRVPAALAGDSPITPIQPSITAPTPSLLPTTPNSEIPNLGSTQYQQSVIFNNDALNNINSQNCALGCLQLNVKHNTLQNSTEFSVGGLIQLGSPDATKIEVAKLSTQASLLDVQIRQKRTEEDMTSALRKELVEAISNRQIPSAILIAKQLSPKLGYADHWQLLADLGLNRSAIDRLLQSSSGRYPVHSLAMISRSINF
jgi:hypothetical protein